MFKNLLTIIVIGEMLLFNCTTNPTTGTEVENERFVARIVNPDGSAAVNATVTVLPVTFIPNNEGTAKAKLTSVQKTTDAKGNFNLSDLQEGCYNIYVEKGKLAAYSDSVYISAQGIDKNEFTLDSTRMLEGNVRIQPNHDPRIVEVQILGTQLFTNVDSNGFFSFPRIALGEYRLRCVANQAGYVPTYFPVEVESTTVDTTLPNLITILYTGIPVVEGLQSTFSNQDRSIIVSWNRSHYGNLYEYVIFRDINGVLQPSTEPVAVTTDTFYIDSTIWMSNQAQQTYRYRVAIRDNSMTLGPTYGFSLATIPDHHIAMNISFSMFTRPGEQFMVPFHVESSPSPLVRMIWYFNDSIARIDSFAVQDSLLDYTDTLVFTAPSGPEYLSAGIFLFTCVALNDDGMGAYDSAQVYFTSGNLPDTIRIASDTTDTLYQGNDTLIIYFDTTDFNQPDTTIGQNSYDTLFITSDRTDTVYKTDTVIIYFDTTAFNQPDTTIGQNDYDTLFINSDRADTVYKTDTVIIYFDTTAFNQPDTTIGQNSYDTLFINSDRADTVYKTDTVLIYIDTIALQIPLLNGESGIESAWNQTEVKAAFRNTVLTEDCLINRGRQLPELS